MDWRKRARCRNEDPEMFFPVATTGPGYEAQVAEAKAVCAQCPVRDPCVDWALRASANQGIWGGLTPEERRQLRRHAS